MSSAPPEQVQPLAKSLLWPCCSASLSNTSFSRVGFCRSCGLESSRANSVCELLGPSLVAVAPRHALALRVASGLFASPPSPSIQLGTCSRLGSSVLATANAPHSLNRAFILLSTVIPSRLVGGQCALGQLPPRSADVCECDSVIESCRSALWCIHTRRIRRLWAF